MKTRIRGQAASTRAARCSHAPACLAVAALLASAALTTAQAQVTVQTADVVGQGLGGDVVAPNGASLGRSDTGLNIRLRMPTPQPDEYDYPKIAPGFLGHNLDQPAGALTPQESGNPSAPEAYSLWVFVFNEPSECTNYPGPCDIADLVGLDPAFDFEETPFPGPNVAERRGQGGAFNAAGHLTGGGTLQLSGRVSLTSEPILPFMSPLTNPHGAQVHVAVAPHGALQPDTLPYLIKTAIGLPKHWWLALFDPIPED